MGRFDVRHPSLGVASILPSTMTSENTTSDAGQRDSSGDLNPVGWLDSHGDALFRYALWRVRNEHLAEELVQETLLSAYRAREQFSGRATERTWLISILRRKIVDSVRKSTRSREEAGNVQDAADDKGGLDQVFDSRGFLQTAGRAWRMDAALEVESSEFWAAFDDCVSKLPGSLSDAFTLRELEDLDCAEVCEVLSISASNLWTRLHRARTLLRECLQINWFGLAD
jgi:RNA polymerase sigma-70 factor (ECF subfamily)